MKLCKDCKWYSMASCHNQRNKQFDYVTGENTRPIHSPQFLRESLTGNDCSPQARWFEPKEAGDE